MVNNANPFFVTNYNNLCFALVTNPLNGENYGFWCCAMIVALVERNKFGFADGSIPKPPKGDPHHLLWRSNNGIVAYWILNFVLKEIQAFAIY